MDARPDAVFRWEWEPPPAWVAALRDAYPIEEYKEYPDLVWEPGVPDAPVQRWVLVRSFPVLNDRQEEVWPGVVHRLRTEPVRDVVRHTCRRYWETTRRLRAAWWIIQGDMGGHPMWYSEADAAWYRYLGQPDTPPAAGTLPYAPFDERVLYQLRARDLRQFPWVHPEETQRQLKQLREELRRRTSWEETDALVSEDMAALLPALRDAAAPRTEAESTADWSHVDEDELKETYITAGEFVR